MPNDEKKASYFTRLLIVLFVLFLVCLVWISFFKSQPPFLINSGLITVLLLITVLILSESFDNLSLGKILSLSREVETKKRKLMRLRKIILN